MDTDGARGDFDHYARLVRRLLDVPVGLVSIVEPTRQVFLGAVGLPGGYQERRETPLSHSMCQYVVKDERPLIVSDARLDQRLADNLAIEDLAVVAYAGWPVVDSRGRAVGSLCAIDSVPREWTREEVEILEDLAAACSAELAERVRADTTSVALTSSEADGEQLRALLALSTAIAATETLAEVAAAVVRVSTAELGCDKAALWLRTDIGDGRDDGTSAEPALSGRGRTLTLLGDSTEDWEAARHFARLTVDGSNPLGEALLQRQVVPFETRAAQRAAYPHLSHPAEVGEARAFAPLLLGGRGLGVLVLLWEGQRSFSDQDRVSMAALASYTAQAVHRAQLLQERVDAAMTLQHAMLTDLPSPDGLALTASYLPAGTGDEVGGDWYDAVIAPDGATHLVIGDVLGHDMAAAAAMGQLRSMLRMTAWLAEEPVSGSPAQQLELLERAMRGLGPETMTTVVQVRVEPGAAGSDGSRRATWSSAGHPPAVLVGPDGRSRLLEVPGPGDPVLGLGLGPLGRGRRRDHHVDLPPGSRLLLYTDGLVERSGEHLDDVLQLLLASASRHVGLTGSAYLAALEADLLTHTPTDDVALLLLEIAPASR
jgi:GAF domain-containing protein